MKKISLIFVLIFLITIFIPPLATKAESLSAQYVCIVNACNLFSSPDITSTKICDQDGKEIKILHKAKLDIETEDGAAKLYNENFYRVIGTFFVDNGEIVESPAYIQKTDVVLYNTTIKITPSYNASINTENVTFYQTSGSGEKITLENGLEIYATTTLNFGTRIYLYEGFDTTKAYTPITVEVGGEIEHGYIATKNIQPDGINPMIIYAGTIALGCIGIIIALLFMKNKKKKVA